MVEGKRQNKAQEWVSVKRTCHFLCSLRNDFSGLNAIYYSCNRNIGNFYYYYFFIYVLKCKSENWPDVFNSLITNVAKDKT